jgi:PAS domain-containing protein
VQWLALMDNAEYPVIGMTTRGVVTFWNPCAERVSGLKADTLVGEPLLFKHAEDGARLRQALLATTQDGTTTKLEDVQLYYEDRTVGYWSMLVSPLKPEGVEVSTEQALVLCTDNTFARRIESEVEPLQRKVQKLFAAHEAMMEANEVLRVRACTVLRRVFVVTQLCFPVQGVSALYAYA